MNAAPQASTPSSTQMIRLMGVVSLICGLLIVITYQATLGSIRHNQDFLTREAVSQLLPGLEKQIIYGILPSGDLTIVTDSQAAGPRLFAGYSAAGALLGVVIETSQRGYADVIKAMYTYSPEQQAITGFKVVELKETPGLGDKIVTDKQFLDNFKQLDVRLEGNTKLAHPITTVKHGTKRNAWEVDAISGATISSRAVGRMLQRSAQGVLPVVVKNLDRIRKGE